MWRLVGLSIILGSSVVVLVMGGSVLLFLHVPALILVMGFTSGLLLWSFGSRTGMLAVAFGRMVTGKGVEENAETADIALAASRYALMSGAIGTLIGFVQMLASLTDPSQVGPGIATATLALLYGVVVSEIVCIPVASASGGAPRSRTIPALMAGLIAVVCLLQGGMLLLAFA